MLLHHVLCDMNEPMIRALLNLIVDDSDYLHEVCLVFNQCSKSGESLLDILADRSEEVRAEGVAADQARDPGGWNQAFVPRASEEQPGNHDADEEQGEDLLRERPQLVHG